MSEKRAADFAKASLAKWKLHRNVQFTYKYDQSWPHADSNEAKKVLIALLSMLLLTPALSPRQSAEQVRRILKKVERAIGRLDRAQFLPTSQEEWERILSNHELAQRHPCTLSRAGAKTAAEHMKCAPRNGDDSDDDDVDNGGLGTASVDNRGKLGVRSRSAVPPSRRCAAASSSCSPPAGCFASTAIG